jgi:hypothetical protein
MPKCSIGDQQIGSALFYLVDPSRSTYWAKQGLRRCAFSDNVARDQTVAGAHKRKAPPVRASTAPSKRGNDYVHSPTIFSIQLSGLWQMPEIIYLRDKSIFFRRLAKDYDEAGQHPVCVKLTEVAADLEAQAIALESKRTSGVRRSSESA